MVEDWKLVLGRGEQALDVWDGVWGGEHVLGVAWWVSGGGVLQGVGGFNAVTGYLVW